VAEQVSVAVANILSKEEILEREKEKTKLLEITELIASVKSTPDLLRIIVEKIKPLFNFHDCGLFVLSPDETTHSDWAAVMPEVSPSEWNQMIGSVSENIPHENSPVEWAMNEIDKINTPVLFDFADLLERFPGYPQFENVGLLEMGYRDCLGISLKARSKSIGWFCINALQKNFFKPEQYALFQSVAHSISIAVANILANEDILEREKEKSLLLSISNEIAQIRDLNTLVGWLRKKTSAFLPSNYLTLTLTCQQKNTVHYVWGDDDLEWQQKEGGRVRKGLVNSGIAYKGSFFEHVDLLPEGTVYAIENLDRSLPGLPQKWAAHCGIKESFLVKLIYKGQPIGNISFHGNKKGMFNTINLLLLQNIANQITVTLFNIIANEEVVERELQKKLEIEINNAVLKNEDFPDVLKEIAAGINKAVNCDICFIRIRSEALDVRPFQLFCEKREQQFMVRTREDVLKELHITTAVSEKDAKELLVTINQSTIFTGIDFEAQIEQQPFLNTFKKGLGLKSFLFIPLMLKNKTTAHLIIGSKRSYAFNNGDLTIINNIVTQLSLTLDNRLAFLQIQKLKELLEVEKMYLQEEIKVAYNFNEIVGESEAIKKVFEQVHIVAGTDTTVLIGGETGTGKELIARAIHNISPRRDKLMVKVNCATLPAQLIESELFGHERGAFTGAIDKRIGKFELANGGTIFLDEVGELPIELQAKLLRVIQEREFERIGGKTTLKTDIRIIAATNKDLAVESAEKRFRSDLYYRLNVFPIFLPALRERKEDIPVLALHFTQKFAKTMGKKISAIHTDALHEMMVYDWPGNIRELEHVIEHSVVSSKSTKLSLARPLLTQKLTAIKSLNEFKIKTLNDNEREYILAILKYTNGRIRGIGGAAQLLDIHPNTLESRMQKLGVKKEHVAVQ
jgi:transcriptional regulator with GAF, ATPase, and Fis domain/predicted nucleic acid-binding Zn ribbon protein